MFKFFVRTAVFNVLFYTTTALACILCLPGLLLERQKFLSIIRIWLSSVYFLERNILGLDYEVRGAENLPATGSYIIAAKHQSAYETMKLHLLFHDPAIILKRELLGIPLWGSYLKKADVIAIDRSSPETAIASIQDGALRMKGQGRPIIIFPQGTRVGIKETSTDRPYKVGVARIQEATQLPIIPLALNAGFFWPKIGRRKKPGCVVFEFLPPIEPGLERIDLIQKLETTVESASQNLLQEAQEKSILKQNRPLVLKIFYALKLLLIVYSVCWYSLAVYLKSEYIKVQMSLQFSGQVERKVEGLKIKGFPGPVTITTTQDSLSTPKFGIKTENLKIKIWPIPFFPIKIEADHLTYRSFDFEKPFTADDIAAHFTIWPHIINVHAITAHKDNFHMNAYGFVDLSAQPEPILTMSVEAVNAASLIGLLAADGFIEEKSAMFAAAAFQGLENQEGIATIPLRYENRELYAGPFLVKKF
jgi:1-acyl-sn-glycerol-3-phosphate acyltransferase